MGEAMGALFAVAIGVGFFLALGLAIVRKAEQPPSAVSPPRSSLGGCLGCIGVLALVVIAFVLGGFVTTAVFVGTVANNLTEQERRPIPLLREVAEFLETHREFGRPTGAQPVPDWAHGRRQRVRFDSGRSLLFYTRDGAVMTVYEDTASEGRQKVWGEYASYDSPPDQPETAPEGPAPIDVQAALKRQEEAYQKVMAEKAKKEAAAAEEARKEEEARRKEVEEASERERVEREAREAQARAENLMKMARNLERLKKPKAALDFYRKVVTECPDTPQAKTAAERIKTLGGK